MEQAGLIVAVAALAISSVVAGANILQWIETRKAVSIAAVSAVASQNSAKASEDAAIATQRSIQATVDNFHLDQRAWLSPSTITGLPQHVGQPLRVGIAIKNTGKTPAERVKFEVRSYIAPADERFAFDFSKIQSHSRGFLAPGAEFEAFLELSPLVNQADVDFLKTREKRVYVYGRAVYDDIFKIKHWMTFCYYIDPTGTFFTICEEHNDTDSP